MRSSVHELKFAEPLPGLVLDGSKNTTWRLNNTRVFRPGDELRLIHAPTIRLFAVAAITGAVERTFATLTPDDLEGHEPFKDQDTMLATYAGYYNMPVVSETQLTVVKFEPWLLCTQPGSSDTDVMVLHR